MDMDKDTTAGKLFEAFANFKKLHKMQNHSPIPDLKSSEIHVLFSIKYKTKLGEDGMKVSEISNCLKIASPSVTQFVNSLEENGYVERSMDKGDRRVVRVKLTKKGEEATLKAEESFKDRLNGLVDYLGEEKSNQLIELLSDVYTYFKLNS